MEYANHQIRINAFAPGVVRVPMHRETPQSAMEKLSPMAHPSTVEDIAEAVVYLEGAADVTGTTLYVDGGAHVGHW